jgi:hypothetical protein
MKLTLDPLDLDPQYQIRDGRNVDQAISTRDITFHHLSPEAQAAVRAVGKATFRSWDGQTYNVIYSDK